MNRAPSPSKLRRRKLPAAEAREVAAALRAFGIDLDFFYQNADGWRATYPDEWVAVRHQQLVGHSNSADSLIAELKAQGLNPGDVVIKRLNTDAASHYFFFT
jgi:hypothetical protein